MAKFKEIDLQNIIGYWATKILGPVDAMDLFRAYEKEFGKIDWDTISKNKIQIGNDEYCASIDNEIYENLNKLLAKFLWRDVHYIRRPKSPKKEEVKVQKEETIHTGWLKAFTSELKNDWVKVTCDNGLTFEYCVILLEKDTYLGEPLYCTIIKTDFNVSRRNLGNIVKYMPWLHNVPIQFDEEMIDKYRYTITVPHFNPNKEEE